MGMPQSWKTLDEGMATPELRKATAPATLSSHSFCAAAVPCLGSATSSSATSWNLTFLPAISMPLALSSSMAMRTPFSLSLPKLAWGPDTGPMWPMRITCSWAMATPPMPATTAAIHNFRDIFIAHSSVETGRHVIPVIAAWQCRVTGPRHSAPTQCLRASVPTQSCAGWRAATGDAGDACNSGRAGLAQRLHLGQLVQGRQAGMGHLHALLHEVGAEELHMVAVLVEVARREHGGEHRHLGVELHAHQPVDHGRGHELMRSEEHTSELQSQSNLVCRLLLEKKKKKKYYIRRCNK